MTVWAHGPQVFNWIDLMLAAIFGQRTQMMHMDETFADRAVDRTEGESADDACRAVTGDAKLPGAGIAFVGVYRDPIPRALHDWLR